MKKFLTFILVVVGLFGLAACKGEDPIFKVGKDTGTYAPEELMGWEVERTVYVQIMGPNKDELFNGTVKVTSANPTVYEAFLGAVLTKGISQSSSSESGFVDSIASYVNGTNNHYWMIYNNGEALMVGANSSQIRNGDYIQLSFEAFEV